MASHTATHARLDRVGGAGVRRELRESRLRLEDFGSPVRGIRAPFFARGPAWFRRVKEAGYEYDASLGSVWPGPQNFRMGAQPCPHRRAGVWELPASAMAGGLLPFSLTYLRLCYPVSPGMLPRRPSVFYMHLHEFLPPETASGLGWPLRAALTRNCGGAAWDILARALDALEADLVTCYDLVRERECEGQV